MLALNDDLVIAQGPFLRFSLFISLLAGKLVRRPVRNRLRRQPASRVSSTHFRAPAGHAPFPAT
jgi:hypothetical protein